MKKLSLRPGWESKLPDRPVNEERSKESAFHRIPFGMPEIKILSCADDD
jgi:hypothetical protein